MVENTTKYNTYHCFCNPRRLNLKHLSLLSQKYNIKSIKIAHNFNLLHFLCATFDIMFNLRGGSRWRAPSKIGKNIIFWRKIVIFHTKYPNKFRTSLRSGQFFLSAPPLTWNPGSAHESVSGLSVFGWGRSSISYTNKFSPYYSI